MKTTNNLTPFEATHPGILLKDEIDATPDLTQKALAVQIGVKPNFLNEIIKGKRPITADLAVLLEEALGISADYWMKFQSQYEIDKARIKEKTVLRLKNIEKWNIIKDYVPVKYFKKLGYLKDDLNYDINQIKEIYDVTDLENLVEKFAQTKYAFYRKSKKLEIDEKNIFAWSSLAVFEAKNKNVQSFNSDNINRLLIELNQVFYQNSNTIEKVDVLLSKFGIKLVLLEKPAKTPVDGFSFWSKENPTITMTLRHSRIDNFAFTLMHEIGHIQLHLLNNKNIKFLDIIGGKQAGAYEKEADNYAQEKLIPKKYWETISQLNYYNKRKELDDELVESIAAKEGINPAILLGRICFEHDNYAIKTKICKRLN